ncbi:MAG: radical SAM protein [Candidatus Omnitrophota bacterium]
MKRELPKLLIADKNNRIYDIPHLQATGMKGGQPFRLDSSELIELHPDSELFMLPDRGPIGFDRDSGQYVRPEDCYAVAAFLAPGFTATYNASYHEQGRRRALPLFSYVAVAFYKDRFYASGIRIDREKRQELKGMDMRLVRRNIKSFRKLFPKNRLVRHLEGCALCYGCPAAKNFFLKRYECPLPTSPTCNARCIGCISYQPGKGCSVTQPRIDFVPTAEEVAEVALFHIRNVRDPVISFGQGCEGEPLMVGDLLEKSIRLIRKSTTKGIINLNTNSSKPDVMRRLFEAGLDSIRVSMSSVREDFYSRYYIPRGYGFKDVLTSIKFAKKAGGFVSINYLVMPGFTDSRKETKALFSFLEKMKADMIQWRNLNYDPMAYFRKLKLSVKREEMLGMRELIEKVKKEFPSIMHGYFNPSKTRIHANLTRLDLSD